MVALEKFEPGKPPKEFCVRGHQLSDVGYYLVVVRKKNGGVGPARRCRRCAIDDVRKCKAKGRERA